jgi:hypothetical protein
MNGHYKRKKKLIEITGKIEELIEEDSKKLVAPPEENRYSGYKAFADFRLKWMKVKTDIYMVRKVAKLKFDKYIQCAATLSSLLKTAFGVTKGSVFWAC